MSIFKRSKKTEDETSREAKIKETGVRSFVPSKIKEGIIRPRLSEKATDQSKDGKYTFIVRDGATKNSIKEEASRRFSVGVVSVRTIQQKGKRKKWGARKSQRSGIKKAIITLRAGDKIDVL
jgi:large subunit ribosomal protein L23